MTSLPEPTNWHIHAVMGRFQTEPPITREEIRAIGERTNAWTFEESDPDPAGSWYAKKRAFITFVEFMDDERVRPYAWCRDGTERDLRASIVRLLRGAGAERADVVVSDPECHGRVEAPVFDVNGDALVRAGFERVIVCGLERYTFPNGSDATVTVARSAGRAESISFRFPIRRFTECVVEFERIARS